MRILYPIIPLIVVSVLVMMNPDMMVAALIPITLCGMITVRQITKTTSEPDYATNVYFYAWIFLFISTFISPLIHFYHDYWVSYMTPRPYKWNNYATTISVMYLVGILIWLFIFQKDNLVRKDSTKWELNKYWRHWIFIFLLVSFIAQMYVYSRMGGILGYIYAYTEGSEDSFKGLGLFFMLSESFPYTLIIYLILKFKNRNISRLGFFALILFVFLVTLFFGGLRGSRSNTILFIVITVIAMNIYIYKVQKGDMVVLLIGFFIFMYVGRMYKDYGANMLKESTTVIQDKTDLSSVETTIIGDLARYDVNAYELFILDVVRPNYRLRWGETYLWGALTFIPGGSYIIKKFNLKGRSPAAAELFFGFQDIENSRILGPIGEWFINFGRYTFFIIYFIIGFFIRYIRRYTQSLSLDDIRFLIVPSLVVFIPQLVLSDFSNICFFFVKRVVVVFILLFLISQKKTATA